MKSPVRITITGAAGQIGYQLAFRIASGQMLGTDQPVILQLLEIPPALPALNGVVMELDDCAFPTLAGIVATDDPSAAFKASDYALLVGARPRGPGMVTEISVFFWNARARNFASDESRERPMLPKKSEAPRAKNDLPSMT